MIQIGTLFSGGGGVEMGALAAGLTPVWGIEWDREIADVHQSNLPHQGVVVADVMDIPPASMAEVDVLHASPPCPNFSVAKKDRGETENDIRIGETIAGYLHALKPPVFTLENVYLYRKAHSFRMIVKALFDLGYQFDWSNLDAADYGVPQTRRRLWLIAKRDGPVSMPPSTHAPIDQISPILDSRKPHVGWFESVEDIVMGFPDDEFAPWQLERLPEEYLRQPQRAFILGGARMFNTDDELTKRDGDKPSPTVDAHQTKHPLRAFMVGINTNDTSGAKIYVDEGEPAHTVRAGGGGRVPRAWAMGVVKRITPRGLARFQTFPDDYDLPDNVKLACTVIGNAVPPLMYQRIAEHVMR